jgi:DNA-directed RNA polymerase specialized sigma24 family protein
MGVDFANQVVVSEYARTTIRVKAKQVVRQPGFSRSDLEDVEQELIVYLLCKAQQFDPNRGSLNTFISRVVDSGVAMLVRGRERAKRNPAGDAGIQSLEKEVSPSNGESQPLARLIGQRDLERRTGGASPTDTELFELVDDVASVLPTLPPKLQEVCCSLLIRKRSETEAELGMSRRALRTAIAAIRKHFEKHNLTKN